MVHNRLLFLLWQNSYHPCRKPPYLAYTAARSFTLRESNDTKPAVWKHSCNERKTASLLSQLWVKMSTIIFYSALIILIIFKAHLAAYQRLLHMAPASLRDHSGQLFRIQKVSTILIYSALIILTIFKAPLAVFQWSLHMVLVSLEDHSGRLFWIWKQIPAADLIIHSFICSLLILIYCLIITLQC